MLISAGDMMGLLKYRTVLNDPFRLVPLRIYNARAG